ncbi:hypothetical protein [Moorena sp. SIO4G3]|uniref:hypothetical protein n=1 Tax=Moorena sp. SIO4G3 TaxID=2607821 RepID=UPI001429840F|nr:hypothetical protein [Moorena sp. SIO4G3]NEO74756.1 hypothetical protein [Moorena sp. SIO4G3]
MNQTNSPSHSPLLATAHQTINHSRCRVGSEPNRLIKKRDREAVPDWQCQTLRERNIALLSTGHQTNRYTKDRSPWL